MPKTIIKENGQIFEVCKSRKEFLEHLKFDWLFWEDKWIDEDASLTIYYNDGTSVSYMLGDVKRPLRSSKIIGGHYSNSHTSLIFNLELKYNEKYEDWEVDEELII